MNSDERYVYYALHYEHERSTNPDGGIIMISLGNSISEEYAA